MTCHTRLLASGHATGNRPPGARVRPGSLPQGGERTKGRGDRSRASGSGEGRGQASLVRRGLWGPNGVARGKDSRRLPPLALRTCVHVLLSAALLLPACASEEINLHGSVEAGVGASCSEASDSPEDIVGRQITIRDGSGIVIGTTDLAFDELEPGLQNLGCVIRASYRVDVPEADFYELELEGIPGATDPISFEELESDGFRYDFTVSE